MVWSGAREVKNTYCLDREKIIREKCQNIHSGNCRLHTHRQYMRYKSLLFFIFEAFSECQSWNYYPMTRHSCSSSVQEREHSCLLFSSVTLIPIRLNANLCCGISQSFQPQIVLTVMCERFSKLYIRSTQGLKALSFKPRIDCLTNV